MKPNRLYLAGPMSGIKDLNFPAFNAEAARLRALGYEVTNPAEVNGGAAELVATANMTAEERAEHWRHCMRRDIPLLLTCDAVALLPGWQSSRGATLEVHIAEALDMPVSDAAALQTPVIDDQMWLQHFGRANRVARAA